MKNGAIMMVAVFESILVKICEFVNNKILGLKFSLDKIYEECLQWNMIMVEVAESERCWWISGG